VIEGNGKILLVDAGLSAKQLTLRLESLGIQPETLTGILLTHEHGDHTRGLDVFLRKYKVPVLASVMTGWVVQEKMKSQAEWVSFESGQKFSWEGFDLKTFALPHDAVEPVGYVIGAHDLRVGVVTDLGHVDAQVLATLKGVQGLVLEANYEWKMLEADMKRPFSTKQRISSRHGHLSNEQAAELLVDLIPEGLQKVVLAHLSSDCNSPQVAIDVMREKLSGNHLDICCALQDEVTAWQNLIPEMNPAFYGELFKACR